MQEIQSVPTYNLHYTITQDYHSRRLARSTGFNASCSGCFLSKLRMFSHLPLAGDFNWRTGMYPLSTVRTSWPLSLSRVISFRNFPLSLLSSFGRSGLRLILVPLSSLALANTWFLCSWQRTHHVWVIIDL